MAATLTNLARNLRAGLRLALMLPVARLSFRIDVVQAIALFVLHVGAALKHQFVNRDETLAHMVPGLRAPNETEPPPKNPMRGRGRSRMSAGCSSGGTARKW